MKTDRSTFLLVILFYLFLISACGNSNKDSLSDKHIFYYIDAVNGNDEYIGTSEKYPFASLEKINEMVLKPGTKVLFKSGTVYNGQLKPQGMGEAGNPVIFSKYGGEKKPQINGNGEFSATVHLYNLQYFELHDLEITNSGGDPQPGRRGIIIEAENLAVSRHIVLNNLFIHDVNGSMIKQKGGGSAILWKNHGEETMTRFDSLIIENCHIKNCTRNAINSSGYTDRDRWYPSTHVIIRNNQIEGVPGDGIVPIGTDGALIEYNLMRDCPDVLPFGEAAAGIWPWSSDNTLIQFNEVAGHKAKWDGQGFDSDWNCLNTTIQYNYSHDNYGGFLLVCNNGENYNTSRNAGTVNTVVRYNLSVNDGIRPYKTARRGWFSPTMHLTGPVENTLFLSNIFIISKKQKVEIDRTVVQMDNWGGPWPKESIFLKNIFMLEEEGKIQYGKDQRTIAKQNIIIHHGFDLIQDASHEIPEWAKSQVNDLDKNFKVKLINAFLEDNEVMKNNIEELPMEKNYYDALN